MELREPLPQLSAAEKEWLVYAVREVMLADGKVHPGEEALLADLARRLHLRVVAGATRTPPPITPAAETRRFLLAVLHWMAQADRAVDAKEVRALRRLTAGWEVSDEEVQEAAAAARGWAQSGKQLDDLFGRAE